jgi:hypothetical protein
MNVTLADKPTTNALCVYNIGGKKFTFSKERIEAIGSISRNILSIMYSEQWNNDGKERYIDINPEVFKKWFDPYIRHGIMPDLNLIACEQEKKVVSAAAELLGFGITSSTIPKELSYLQDAFGPNEWEKYFGIKVSDRTTIPQRLIDQLNKPCPFDKTGKSKVWQTHMLVYIPKEMSIDRIMQLSMTPIVGCRTIEGGIRFDRRLYLNIHSEYKDSYWILISKQQIAFFNSSDKDPHIDKFKSYFLKYDGYTNPSVLECALSFFATFVKTGIAQKGFLPRDDNGMRQFCLCENNVAIGGFQNNNIFIWLGSQDTCGKGLGLSVNDHSIGSFALMK